MGSSPKSPPPWVHTGESTPLLHETQSLETAVDVTTARPPPPIEQFSREITPESGVACVAAGRVEPGGGDDSDLEAGPSSPQQPQCRICLDSDGRDFIAPCKCKGSSKYVHRACLDQWRSIKEGFAFAHCTICRTPFHLRVQAPADRAWRTVKFRFFVTRDILLITAAVQTLVAFLGYLVYLLDSANGDALRNACKFSNKWTFYYLCGILPAFALMGLAGCIFTCVDRRMRQDLAQPCREVCLCCCHVSGHVPGTLCLWTDCGVLVEGCAATAGDCVACASGLGPEGAPLLVLVGLGALVLLAVVGAFYSMLVATMLVQRVWQRHYHIIAKRMLTKEYVVEDVDWEELPTDWQAPSLPPEHVQQLRSLRLL